MKKDDVFVKRDYDEISIGKLFTMVFNHFIMIAALAILGAVLGFAVGKLTRNNEIYDVTANIRIYKSPVTDTLSTYNQKGYTVAEITSVLKSETNIAEAYNSAPGANIALETVNNAISVSGPDKTSGEYTVKVVGIENPEFYKSVISEMFTAANAYVMSEIEKGANVAIGEVRQMLDLELEKEPVLESAKQAQYDNIAKYEKAIKLLESYLEENTYEPINVVNLYQTNTPTGLSPLITLIIGFLAGGVIGVATAWIIDFNDKRIYSSKDFLYNYNENMFFAGIPLYAGGLKKESKDFVYLANKIDENKEVILVSSLSASAGKSSIAQGLAKALEEKGNKVCVLCNPTAEKLIKEKASIDGGIIIIDGTSYLTDADALNLTSWVDLTLVVVRAGIDTSTKLTCLFNDLIATGAPDFSVIFNAVEYKDSMINAYEDSKAYRKFIWLVNNWKRFYKKAYLNN